MDKTTNNLKTHSKYIMLKIIIIIAVVEFFAMQIISMVNIEMSIFEEALLDALLLSLLSAPLLYKFVISPFILKHKESIEILDRTNEVFSTNVIASDSDANGIITYVSQALCAISGYTKEELIGKPHNILKHPDTPSSLFKEMWQVLLSGNIWYAKYKNKKKDGTFYWISMTILPEFNDSGIITGYRSISHDITQEKVKDDLQKRLELSLIGSNDGIWDWNLKTNNVYFSPRWKEMLGYSDDEFKNEFSEWQSRVHPDDVTKVLKEVQDNIDGKTQYYTGSHRLKHKNGSWIWIMSRGKAIYEDGKPIRMTGTHTDITQEKEEELKYVERGRILENSLNEIYIVDAKTYKFLYINKVAEGNIGYKSQEIKDLTLVDIERDFTKESLEVLYNPLEKENEENLFFTTIHTRKDKSVYDVDVYLQKTFYEDKEAYVCIVLDTTDRVNAKRKLQHQAHHDALTGLPNRVLFNDRLEQAIIKAKRNKSKIAVIFIDLDHFKEINDSLGHDAGDMVLKTITQKLQSIVRAEDTISRLGGDEFTILLEDLTKLDDATMICNKVLQVLAQQMLIGGHKLYVTSSIGISIYPDDGLSPANLLKYADSAMYKAKAEGRNNVQYYDSKLTDLAFERVVLETSLRIAIQNNEFIVHYQPQIDARDDSVIGMEALVRWNHPTMGLMSPFKFIGLAETTGLIVQIDRIVMKMAMEKIVQWHEAGLNPGVMAINLSVKQLQSDDCLSTFVKFMQEIKCKPEWVELEVTESQIMENPEKAIKILQGISDLGVKLAVDDFGTGYSSLAYLKRLPIDKLKIDREFIKDLPGDEEDSGITKAVIALSKSLHLRVIAEGVETAEQRDFLVANGCSSIQGYFYSKPIPEDELESFLRAKI